MLPVGKVVAVGWLCRWDAATRGIFSLAPSLSKNEAPLSPSTGFISSTFLFQARGPNFSTKIPFGMQHLCSLWWRQLFLARLERCSLAHRPGLTVHVPAAKLSGCLQRVRRFPHVQAGGSRLGCVCNAAKTVTE